MPISSLYLLARAAGYRERARKVRELAATTPADAQRLADIAGSLESKAIVAEERAWSIDTIAAQGYSPKLRLHRPDHPIDYWSGTVTPRFKVGDAGG